MRGLLLGVIVSEQYLDKQGTKRFKEDFHRKFADSRYVLNTISEEWLTTCTKYDILCIITEETLNTYTVRITIERDKNIAASTNLLGLQNVKFLNLEYKECSSAVNPSNLIEECIFENSDGVEFPCTISISSRNSDNSEDDNAPHNMFAPYGKRTSKYQRCIGADNVQSFVATIHFDNNIPYEYISDMNFFVYTTGGNLTVTYEIINNLNTVVYTSVTEIIDQKGRITLNTNEENSTIEDVTIDPLEEFINTVEVLERGNIFAS